MFIIINCMSQITHDINMTQPEYEKLQKDEYIKVLDSQYQADNTFDVKFRVK